MNNTPELIAGMATVQAALAAQLKVIRQVSILLISPNVSQKLEAETKISEWLSNSPHSLRTLAKHSWFVDMDMGMNEHNRLTRNYDLGRSDLADEELVNHYHHRFDSIIQKLKHAHPNRQHLFSDLYNCYRTESYSAFVTLAMTQLDGIAKEIDSEAGFYKKTKDTQQLKLTETIEKKARYRSFYLEALQPDMPITAYTKSTGRASISLNRHNIIHGSDTKYGIQINALKVLSCLQYVSDLVTFVLNKEEDFNS